MNEPTPCGLCGRGFPGKDWLTKHHCLPKSKGGTSEDVSLIPEPSGGRKPPV